MESAPATERVGSRLNGPFNDKAQLSLSARIPLRLSENLIAANPDTAAATDLRDPESSARRSRRPPPRPKGGQFRIGGQLGHPEPGEPTAASVLPGSPTVQRCTFDYEAMAAALGSTGDYRVLRRVRPRDVRRDHTLAPGEAVAVIVDVETTGLDHRRDEVIELGMVAFVHDQVGQIGPVLGTLSQLRQPSTPIPPKITKLTGIADEMVAGQMIDLDAVRALVGPASLVIAHHAGLDTAFRDKAWGCSMREVPWTDLGYEGAKLGHLLMQAGRFHRGHRAVDDCHALLELLASRRGGAESALGHLLASAAQPRIRLWATASPFDRKDALRARGYRWNNGDDGRVRSWWVELPEDGVAEEMRFLREEVFRRRVDLPCETVTARERYRAG